LNITTGMIVPAPVNRIAEPAQMIEIADSDTFLSIDPLPQPQTSIPIQLYIAFPYIVYPGGYLGVGSWHDGGANAVFGDAHVEYKPQSVWIAATAQSRRLWNNDNQPHPEWW
jgi:prepilin-type processing-associated H-X9-DG protein